MLDDPTFPILAELAHCLCAEVALSPGGATCFCGIIPGQLMPMDFCNCGSEAEPCGQAFVQLDSLFPSTRLPAQVNDHTSCNAPLAMEVKVGVYRCLPGLDGEGNPPDESQQLEAQRIAGGDMWAAYRAMHCCLNQHRRMDALIGRFQPLGPAGDCGGGYWRMWMRVT